MKSQQVTVHHAYFVSIMTDGIAIWGCSKQVEYIFILFKKAISRIIEKLPQRTPCKDLFKKTTFQPSLATIFWNWHV